MRYIIRKFVDADTVQEAMRKERKTPVHDCYLKEGEQPKSEGGGNAIGFQYQGQWYESFEQCGRKR